MPNAEDLSGKGVLVEEEEEEEKKKEW